tara:strand:- start:36 stop:497 length:462 start_codon:yes stop_codon:yes gene_type:complete
MTYNSYLSGVSDSLLCEFYLGSDHTLTSTSSFGDTLPIGTISGDSEITLSSNIITLPAGYEFLVRFYIGIQRSNVSTFIYTKLYYSDSSSIDNVITAMITGTNANESSIEETCAVIDTSNGSKSIIIKGYKSDSNTTSILDSLSYGYILGFRK